MRFIPLFLFLMITQKVVSQALRQKIDAVFQENAISEKTANALLVIQNGKVVYGNTTGLANLEESIKSSPKTNFRMASVTKQFTAGAIFLLQKQGKLQLNQTLSNFFPDFAEIGKEIQLKNLLTHTSGIVDYEEIMPNNLTNQLSDSDVLEMVKTVNKTYFKIGSQYRYSNTAFCLLALIIEKVSGKSYDDFLKTEIFEPLGMNNSMVYGKDKAISNRAIGYAKNEKGEVFFSDQSLTSATKGDGGVYTSLTDYEKWFRFRKAKLGIKNHELFELSNTLISEDNYYSFGWFIHRKVGSPDVWFHSGSTCGFSNLVIEVPENQILIVYFSNLTNHHDFFKPIEEVLIQEKILPKHFSFWKLHEKTN